MLLSVGKLLKSFEAKIIHDKTLKKMFHFHCLPQSLASIGSAVLFSTKVITWNRNKNITNMVFTNYLTVLLFSVST